MSTSSWLRLKDSASGQLVHACPALTGHRAARTVEALITILALAGVVMTARPIAGRLEVDLDTAPTPQDDPLAKDILQEIADAISAHAREPRPPIGADLASRFDGQDGFAHLIADLLSAGASQTELTAIAEIIGGAMKSLAERTKTLAVRHLHDLLARDLPQAAFLHHQLTTTAAWLLAPETSGQLHRSEILKRRLQAQTTYGALSNSLRDPGMTQAIDEGLPHAPLLMRRHGLAPAELRALREARGLVRSIEDPLDFHFAVEELKAHDVPLREWPGAGQPGHPEAWEGCVWSKAPRQQFIRPDYIGERNEGVLDAVNAFRDDLLRPLVTERLRASQFPRTRAGEHFAGCVEFNGPGGDARRRFMAAIRSALVGSRRPKAFREAVALWHRRVASLSALRHEKQADRPGWPPLCAPWQSVCGRFEIVALTSAAALVEEGRLLQHCVGGYYEICRRGDTQILSLREDGRRVATIEIRLTAALDAPELQVGQFQARRNTAPSEHLHTPLRDFVRAIRTGMHPMNVAKLACYRKRMRDTWDGAWRSDALPIGHAREVFDLYLPLLPRGTSPDFDEWCVRSGLCAAVDEALTSLMTATSPAIDDVVPY